ncbi:hypothetical protein AX15_001844 [Amanita polypyramis BW_CC]|nr:hypothetical protein AX15_001844 [Amanita polypyramis BW_CC]
MTSLSTNTSTSTASDPKPKSKVPKWVPIAMFAGTSMALVIPLVWVRRQRARAIRDALSSSSSTSGSVQHKYNIWYEPESAPTFTATAAVRFARGGGTSSSSSSALPFSNEPLHLARPPRFSSSSSLLSTTTTTDPSQDSSEFSAPGPKELLSAISRVDYSTAMFAGRAFGIATCIVTVGAVVLTMGIKMAMGVQDMNEFSQRARATIWAYLPGLASRIYRLPETEDERATLDPADLSSSLPASDSDDDHHHHCGWDAAQSEKRLELAYEQGGMPLLARTALRELEAESRYENAKRQEKK